MMTSFKRVVAALFLAVCAVVTLAPQAASAHAGLDKSDPAPSSVLATSPTHITVTFTGNIEKELTSVRLFDKDKREVTIGAASRLASDKKVVQAEVPQLDNGVYVAVWRVVSGDGHPLTGAFPFEIGTASTGQGQSLVAEVLNDIDKSSDLGTPIALARFFAFLGAVLLIGLVSVTWGSTLLQTVRTVRTLQLSASLMALGSIAVLLLQGPYTSGGSWGDIFDANVLGDVIRTRIGISSLVRMAISLEWMLLSLFVAKVSTSLWKNLVIVTSFVTVATYSLSGHPSAGDLPVLFVGVDALHLVAVSLWVGGVLALALFSRSEEITDEVQRFSRVSTFAMPVAAATGIAQAINLVPSREVLTDTQYGTYLIAKVAIVGLVVLLGLYLRRTLGRGESLSVQRFLRRETALVLTVIALTAFMVGESPVIEQKVERRNFSATMVQKEIVGDLQVLPAKVGTSEVHTWFMPPGGMLAPVKKVTVTFALPEREIPNIPVDVVETGPNHWSGITQFPYDGEWTMEVRAVSKEGKDLVYTATVPISK